MMHLLSTVSPFSLIYSTSGRLTIANIPLDSLVTTPTTGLPPSPETFQTALRRYTCPELLSTNDPTRTPDIFSASIVYTLGLIMAEVFTGSIVFDGMYSEEAAHTVQAGGLPDLSGVSHDCPEFALILESCLTHTPSQRPSLQDLRRRINPFVPPTLRMVSADEESDISNSDAISSSSSSLSSSLN